MSQRDLLTCIEALKACIEACESCVDASLRMPDHAPCIRYCRDALDIAELCLYLLVSKGEIQAQSLATCADICARSAEICSRYDDDPARQAARACQRCAELCRRLAESQQVLAA